MMSDKLILRVWRKLKFLLQKNQVPSYIVMSAILYMIYLISLFLDMQRVDHVYEKHLVNQWSQPQQGHTA